MCFKTRKAPSIAIGILSGLVIFVGLVMAILSFRFKIKDPIGDEAVAGVEGDNTVSSFRNSAFIALLVTSCIAIIIGFCGVTLMCIRRRGCALAFGCILTPAWVAFLVIGVVVALFSNSSKTTI